MKRLLLGLLCAGIAGYGHAAPADKRVDVLLVGGGIMSATLGTYLHELEPNWKIDLYERLDSVAGESSNAWNNAGTGHSAFCELNYTPERADGSIDISKALAINEQFEISKQFWAHQVERKVLTEPKRFINNVPHMSFVWGDDNIEYLRKRHAALEKTNLFRGMEFSEDPVQIAQWIPLVMHERDAKQKVAATRMSMGTDVNFGEITRQLIDTLSNREPFTLNLHHEVSDLERNGDGSWRVTVFDLAEDKEHTVDARFVFIGAGGGALKLLQKSGIEEAKGYAGFPVGGQFLMTRNPELVKQHTAKVYGKASVGSPPMSVPHLDTRVIDGETVLLFGPFATFSTKFLKNGSLLDLFSSITASNLMPMVHAGIDNLDLSQYLIGQLMLSDADRMASLREYFPNARDEDWELIQAGQRVQVIKQDEEHGGILQFGTEVVSAQDGSIAALLGASPGASTAAPIMLSLIEKVFADKVATPEWQQRLRQIIPSYGHKLNDDAQLANRTRQWSSERLGLQYIELAQDTELAEEPAPVKVEL